MTEKSKAPDSHLTDIKGVLFDLDGTLYKKPVLLELLMAAMQPKDLKLLANISSARDSMRGIQYENKDELLHALFVRLAEKTGRSPEAVSRWYNTKFFPSFIWILRHWAAARPGLVSLLGNLKQKDMKIGVLSDFARIRERLEALGISPALFDDMLSVEETGCLKPSPGPFLKSARNLGVPPGQLLVVGDRQDLDARGAEAAGMPFMGIAGNRNCSCENFYPWEVCRSLILNMVPVQGPSVETQSEGRGGFSLP
ncbi:MAG: HAD family hydrolase [Proteobacteria bacterium]|nr:HAD family hydrolase [Pseudomonadota bacterium]